MMFVSTKKAYCAIFYLLDKYYFNIEKSDDVGSMLSEMDLFFFDGGQPADPAEWEIWLDALKEIGVVNFNGECLEDNMALEALVKLLEFRYNEYEFAGAFARAIEYFTSECNYSLDKMWQDSIKKALDTDDYYLRNCKLEGM